MDDAPMSGRSMSDDIGELRDTGMIMMAMLRRIDASLTSLADEVRVMHTRYNRLLNRVAELEGRYP